MHDCEEFRERITEHIIDQEDLAEHADIQRELLRCRNCSDFCAESREMIEALSAVDLTVSERHWDAIQYRLRMRLVNTLAPRLRPPHTKSLTFAPVFAAAAMLLITVGLYRLATPLVNMERLRAPVPRAAYVDHSVPLDPVTVDFLEESELLLRNMMKITANDTDDLADTMRVANGQLADIEQRKDAAADVPPVAGARPPRDAGQRPRRPQPANLPGALTQPTTP